MSGSATDGAPTLDRSSDACGGSRQQTRARALRVLAPRRHHIASEHAIYRDVPHPAFGITGGDGLHVVWEEVAGTARAKWLLWPGERIDARIALQWGVVNEVVAHDRLWIGASRSPGTSPRSRLSTARCKANAQRQPPPPDHPGRPLWHGARRSDRGRPDLPEAGVVSPQREMERSTAGLAQPVREKLRP